MRPKKRKNDDDGDNNIHSILMNNIQCLYKDGTYDKTPSLLEILTESNSIFAVLTETHLNASILDAEIDIPGYTVFRSDRIARIQGGTMIYVKNALASTTSEIYKHCNKVVECLALHVK